MCTVVILRRPGHSWPLLFGANRDEIRTRKWKAPARHWPDRPEVVAGLDLEAGGSWLGLNEHGVLAAILNRVGSLGPQAGKRSRGELVLEALDHADARTAVEQLAYLEPRAYRSFNLVIADNRDAYWLRHTAERGEKAIGVFEIPKGVSMITARDRNDRSSPRIANHLDSFELAEAPDPEWEDWESWMDLMRQRGDAEGNLDKPETGMTIVRADGFETLSSSLIALPAAGHFIDGEVAQPIWLFAGGRPDTNEYEALDLGFTA